MVQPFLVASVTIVESPQHLHHQPVRMLGQMLKGIGFDWKIRQAN
jgi:hypothetical protein